MGHGQNCSKSEIDVGYAKQTTERKGLVLAKRFEKMLGQFAGLHIFLSELSERANTTWPEGGLIWSVEYRHAHAHTAKLGGEYIYPENEKAAVPALSSYVPEWTRLIGAARGDLDFDTSGNRGLHEMDAQKVISWFEEVQCDRALMLFENDETDISFSSAVIFENHAVLHSVFWQID